MANFTSFSIF
jgi:fructose-bisphosphate aldolase class I